MRRAIVLVLGLGLGLVGVLLPGAAADETLDDRTFVFSSVSDLVLYSNYTIDGDQARNFRDFADKDSDGAITDAERVEFEDTFVRVLNHMGDPSATLVDGRYAGTESVTDLETRDLSGSATAEGPIDWSEVRSYRYETASAPSHSFRRQADAKDRGVSWTIGLPAGFSPESVAGLSEGPLSRSGSRVEGDVKGEGIVEVVFSLGGARGPLGGILPTDAPGPGVGALVAAGLGAA
ncbi:MAG: hypothetical protein ACT4PT_08305, partial [Methanobacteriota archaeon]